MAFNRQVLEQVAKDGKTYASLAKEMAKYILGELPQDVEVPDEQKILLASGIFEAKRYLSYGSPYTVYTYDTENIELPNGADIYVYTLKRYKP